MLEFYYDFHDKHLIRQEFKLSDMDTDKFLQAINNDSLDEIVKSRLNQVYEKIWLATNKYREKTSGLLKPKFVVTQGVWFTASYYLVQNQNKFRKNKYSVKVVSKIQSDLHF